MRYVKYIIDQVRRETENEEVSEFIGIQDSEFLQYLNDAQHRLQSKIVAKHPSVFVEETVISVVSGQEAYSLPSDAFLGNKVSNVEFSSTGNDQDYYNLEEISLKRRRPGSSGDPSKYIRKSGKLLLAPIPTSGKIRLNYVKRIPELDLRRGIVSGYFLCSDPSYTTQTTCENATETWATPSDLSSGAVLTLNSSELLTSTTDLTEHQYICIVDKDGNMKMKNIPLSTVVDVNSLILGSHTAEEGESISVGDYVVGGKDTTTHSELPRNVERYLIAYCAWKILKRDSSVDSQEAVQELLQMENDIVESYAVISDDVQYIPLINEEEWTL